MLCFSLNTGFFSIFNEVILSPSKWLRGCWKKINFMFFSFLPLRFFISVSVQWVKIWCAMWIGARLCTPHWTKLFLGNMMLQETFAVQTPVHQQSVLKLSKKCSKFCPVVPSFWIPMLLQLQDVYFCIYASGFVFLLASFKMKNG